MASTMGTSSRSLQSGEKGLTWVVRPDLLTTKAWSQTTTILAWVSRSVRPDVDDVDDEVEEIEVWDGVWSNEMR